MMIHKKKRRPDGTVTLSMHKLHTSIFRTTSIPSTTCPNTTCFPSNLKSTQIHQYDVPVNPTKAWTFNTYDNSPYQSVFSVQIKNCEPFVFGPEFAMDIVPVKLRTEVITFSIQLPLASNVHTLQN